MIRKLSTRHKSDQNQSTQLIQVSMSVKMSCCSRIVVPYRNLSFSKHRLYAHEAEIYWFFKHIAPAKNLHGILFYKKICFRRGVIFTQKLTFWYFLRTYKRIIFILLKLLIFYLIVFFVRFDLIQFHQPENMFFIDFEEEWGLISRALLGYKTN